MKIKSQIKFITVKLRKSIESKFKYYFKKQFPPKSLINYIINKTSLKKQHVEMCWYLEENWDFPCNLRSVNLAVAEIESVILSSSATGITAVVNVRLIGPISEIKYVIIAIRPRCGGRGGPPKVDPHFNFFSILLLVGSERLPIMTQFMCPIHRPIEFSGIFSIVYWNAKPGRRPKADRNNSSRMISSFWFVYQ